MLKTVVIFLQETVGSLCYVITPYLFLHKNHGRGANWDVLGAFLQQNFGNEAVILGLPCHCSLQQPSSVALEGGGRGGGGAAGPVGVAILNGDLALI